jgi:hypothetical protein
VSSLPKQAVLEDAPIVAQICVCSLSDDCSFSEIVIALFI